MTNYNNLCILRICFQHLLLKISYYSCCIKSFKFVLAHINIHQYQLDITLSCYQRLENFNSFLTRSCFYVVEWLYWKLFKCFSRWFTQTTAYLKFLIQILVQEYLRLEQKTLLSAHPHKIIIINYHESIACWRHFLIRRKMSLGQQNLIYMVFNGNEDSFID